MGVKQKIYKTLYNYLELKQTDKHVLIKFGILSLLTGIITSVYDIITIGVFLDRTISIDLPFMFVAIGFAGIIYAFASYFFTKNGSLRFYLYAPFVASILIIISFLIELLFSHIPIVQYIPIAISFPLNLYLIRFLYSKYKSYIPVSHLRRIEWLLEFCFLFGITLGSYFTLGLMYTNISPVWLYLIPILASISTFILLFSIKKQFPFNAHFSEIPISQRIYTYNYEIPFVRLLILLIAFSGITYGLVQFGFLSTIQNTFNNGVGYIKFMALFMGSVFMFSFFIKHFLLRKLLFPYDTPYNAILAPFVYTISLIVFIAALYILDTETLNRFTIFFMGILLFKLLYISGYETIEKTSLALVLKPLNIKIQKLFEINIIPFFIHIGILISGFIMLIISGAIPSKSNTVIYPLIAITLAQLIITFFTLKKYRIALKEYILNNARKKGNPIKTYLPLKERLYKLNVHKNAKEMIYALSLAENLFPGDFKNALKYAFNSNDNSLMSFAISKLYTHKIIDDEEFIEKITKKITNPDNLSKALALKEFYTLKVKSNVSPEKIEQLAHSKITQDRILAANLISICDDDKLVYTLSLLLRDYEGEVRKTALITASSYRRKYLLPSIVEFFIYGPNMQLAYDALLKYGVDALDYLEQFFLDKQLEEVQQLRLIRLYQEIASEKAQESLLQKIDSPSGEITYQSLLALKKIGFKISRKHLNRFLSVILKYAQILAYNYNVLAALSLNGKYNKIVLAVQNDITFNTNILYSLLSTVYGSELIKLIRNLSEKFEATDNAFAIELIDEIVDENITPIIVPLIHLQRIAKRMMDMEYYFPLEVLSAEEAITEIITSETRYFSNWTKVICLSTTTEPAILESYALKSYIFHNNPILREAASRALYNYSEQEFEDTIERTSKSISGHIRANVLDNSLHSLIHVVEFLQQNTLFKRLSVTQLMIFTQYLSSSDEEILNDEFLNFIVRRPIIIFNHGDFLIDIKGERIKFSPGIQVFDLEMIGDMNNITKFKTNPGLMFYYLDKETLKKAIFDLPELGTIFQKIIEEIYSLNPQLPENFYNYTHQKNTDALMLADD